MSTKHLSNDEVDANLFQFQAGLKFFSVLKQLLHTQSVAKRGSIFLTQKRLTTSDSETTSLAAALTSLSPSSSSSLSEANPLSRSSILIRVTNGRKKDAKSKASTLVAYDELEGFYTKYAEICKEGMIAMRKRDRSGKKKAKGKAKK
ncbi:hypothetical protein KEM54_003545 [Ascosphaera aggregata]|nr:hypothetical protein KEM54_003545 [Ascosphaera aggregata]